MMATSSSSSTSHAAHASTGLLACGLDAFVNTIVDVVMRLDWEEQQLKKQKEAFALAQDALQLLSEEALTCQYLKVGGTPFHTSLDVLQRHQPHMLSILTSDIFASEVDGEGYICIDRDSRWFATVLQYLRDDHMMGPDDCEGRTALEEELAFYSISVSLETLIIVRLHNTFSNLRYGVFDPKSSTWQPSPSKLDLFTSICCCSGPPYIYVVGGTPCPGYNRYTLGCFDVRLGTLHLLVTVPLLDDHDGAVDGWALLEHVCGCLVLLPKRYAATKPLVFNLATQTWVSHQLERLPPDSTCVVDDRLYAVDAEGRFFCARPPHEPWQRLPPLPHRRWKVSLVAWDNKVVALGGLTSDGPSNSVEVYDPHDGLWHTLPPMLCGRSDAAVTVVDGCIFAIGGNCDGFPVEKFNPASHTWTGSGDARFLPFYGEAFAARSLNGLVQGTIGH